MQVSAVIPAAGNSGRMGRDKAVLHISHGQTFAGHLVNCFGVYGCRPVVLVVNDRSDTKKTNQENIITVVNHNVDLGRSHSIWLGLHYVPEGFSCFIHNVDNPYLEPEMLDWLLGLVQPDSFVVPVNTGRGGHPVLLGSRVAAHLRDQDQPADFRKTLHEFKRLELSWPDDRILLNINTPEDYKRFILGKQ